MDPIVAVLNAGLIVCAGLLVHGLLTRRCFAIVIEKLAALAKN